MCRGACWDKERAVLRNRDASFGNPAPSIGAYSYIHIHNTSAWWLVFGNMQGPVMPAEREWVNEVRAKSLRNPPLGH